MGDDDQVGYRKPPQRHQFKKGQSGNPRGRPKGRKNYHTRFHDIMNETVIVREKGREKRMSKFDVFVSQMVNKAATGDAQAQRNFRDWFRIFASGDDKDKGIVFVLSPEDLEY